MAKPPDPLWPVHLKPHYDELLSSWLVRIAHGHGLKIQSFCNLIFGGVHQVWNRDVDRLAPDWLIHSMCAHTAVPVERGYSSTLRSYEGTLYQTYRSSGILRWILPLMLYHRRYQGFGLQFCPKCLGEGPEPYFRKHWRVACNLVCAQHNLLLLDRCPRCSAAVAFHRLELGHPKQFQPQPMSLCYECGFDLRDSGGIEPSGYDADAWQWLLDISRWLQLESAPAPDRDILPVLHQICKVMLMGQEGARLRRFVEQQAEFVTVDIPYRRAPVEQRDRHERQHILHLALWLLMQPEERLSHACHAGAIHYNRLLRDFAEPPGWYASVVENIPHRHLYLSRPRITQA